MNIDNENKRLNFEKKNIKIFTTISGFSTLGMILGGKSFFQNALGKVATPESILKIAISGGILILSTKALAIGIQGYSLSKMKKEQIEKNIKTLKK